MSINENRPNDEDLDHTIPNDPDPGNVLDSDELANLVADYVDRHQLGETLDPARILEEHGPEGAQIVEALQTFFDLDTSGGPESFVQKLGGLQLSRVIGRGGMAIVYEGFEEALDRRVAVKVLPTGAVSDGRALRRFLREARTAARLRHANVVTVHGVGLASGVPYFSMEFVQGETLAALWTRLDLVPRNREEPEKQREALLEVIERLETSSQEPAPASTASMSVLETRYVRACAQAFIGAARGLQHAHEQGVVHRDLKPSNLILDESGMLRILDFGLARLDGDASLTVTGSLVGTPLYMSPEQIRSGWSNESGPEPDRRTDIYSLGVTLYQTLARRHPFEGASPRQVLRETLETDPPPLPSSVPAPLQAVVLRCLRKEPERRYATAEALAQDLDRFYRGEPVEARPASRLIRYARQIWSRRYRIASALLAIALMVVVAIALRQNLGKRTGMVERTLWEADELNSGFDVAANRSRVAFIDWMDFGAVRVRDLETGDVIDATAIDGPGNWYEYASNVLISPDGSSVVFTWETSKDPAKVRGELYRVDLDQPTIRRKISVEAKGYHSALDWAADADLLLSTARSDEGPAWILVSPYDGRVTLETSERSRNARLSPDARYIAYERRPSPSEAHRDLWLLDLWTGAENALLIGPDDDRLLDFSPDGGLLVFASDRLGSSGLWVLPLEEGKPAGPPSRVQRGFENASAGIASDGTFYSVESWNQEQAWVADPDPRGAIVNVQRLLRRAAGSSTNATWSPTGERLAFRASEAPVGWHAKGTWKFFIWDLESRREREVQLSPPVVQQTRARGPYWLDDSTLVLFATLEGKGAGFWAVDAKNGQTRSLVKTKSSACPNRFQVAANTLWYMERGKERRRLIRFDIAGRRRTEIEGWPPMAPCPTVSPDGARFAYLRERQGDETSPGSLIVGELDRPEEHRAIPWPWLESSSIDVFLSWTDDLRGIVAYKIGRESDVRVLDLESGEERIWEGFPGYLSKSIHEQPLGGRVAFSTNIPGFRLVSLSGWLTD